MLQPTFFSDLDTAQSSVTSDPPMIFVILFACGFGLIAGALFGWAQWMPLRKHATHAWVWIPANAFGWAAAIAGIYVGATIPSEQWNLWQVIGLGTVTGIVAGLMIGAITGVALLGVLSHGLIDIKRTRGGQN